MDFHKQLLQQSLKALPGFFWKAPLGNHRSMTDSTGPQNKKTWETYTWAELGPIGEALEVTGPEVLEVTGPGLSLQERPHAGGPKTRELLKSRLG